MSIVNGGRRRRDEAAARGVRRHPPSQSIMARRSRYDRASFQPLPTVRGHPMSILWTIIIGLIVGALAKFVLPGKDPGGIIITILLGIVGAFVGTFLGRALGLYAEGQAAGWIMSVIGAVIVLLIYRMVVGRRGPVV